MENDFTMREGWMTESSVHDLASWYHEECPRTDVLSFEAHLMVLRTYGTLATGSPIELDAGLSRARYNILRMLYQAPDRRLLMGDFVQGMHVSPTNITKLIDTLVSDGLVERVAHEVDKRKTWARLTPAGQHLLERALPDVGEHVESLWSGLDPEEKTVLIHLLAKMRMHYLGAERPHPADVIKQHDETLTPASQ
jgi:DNA-binding MarR family transcriptional regulator